MFSSDSRWDRHTPEQNRSEEQIDVVVVFKGGKTCPQSFVWRGRRYQVTEVTYHWEEKRGANLFHFYTVTDGTNLYKLYLNTRYLYWRMVDSCPLQ